jgi:hypothetical protein
VVTGRKSPARRNDFRDPPDNAAPRILVVEDDLDLGETVCEVLKMSGYRASHATDGLVAPQTLREGKYNGLDTTREFGVKSVYDKPSTDSQELRHPRQMHGAVG